MAKGFAIKGIDTATPTVEEVARDARFATFDDALREILRFQHAKMEQAEDALTWTRDLARKHHGQIAPTIGK